MARSKCQVLAWLTVLMLAGTSAAQMHHAQSRWDAFWHRFWLDAHRNNAYPEPFRYADRQILYSAWTPYIARGWQMETTISDQHFEKETGKLTVAGKAKVKWIATQAPQQHRTIYVVRGATEEETDKRIDHVQRWAATVAPAVELPGVVQSDVAPVPTRMNGLYTNEIWKKSEESIAPPVLPAATATTGSGG